MLEESECDGSHQQEEGLYWGKVGRLMGKDVDQLQQSRGCWSAEVRLTRTGQHPWNTGGDPSHGRHLTHSHPGTGLYKMISRAPTAQSRQLTCRVRSRAEAWGTVLYIRPSISQSCGTMGAKSSSSVLTDFSKMAHTALGRKQGDSC